MSRLPAFLVSACMLATATPVAAENLCFQAMTALRGAAESLACVATPNGVAIAPDLDRAGQLSRLGEAGEGRFRTHFGRDPSRYVIAESLNTEELDDPHAVLTAAGFDRILMWFSQEHYVEQVTGAIRASAESAARGQGLDEASIVAAGDRAVAARSMSRLALDAREAQVVPHELGHGWYVRAYWPDYEAVAHGHYGGPGPDWLDEISAMLMEDGNGAEERRVVFRDVYQGRSTGALASYPVANLIDLPHFLSREHPVKTAPEVRPTASSSSASVTMRVISPTDLGRMTNALEAALYYTQGRMFADFLLDRTGDPQVFGALAEAFARGETFEYWLREQGPSRRLPVSISELDALWLDWLSIRFGPPSSAGS